MSVLLPWNRQKAAEQGTLRYPSASPVKPPVKGTAKLTVRTLAVLGLAAALLAVWGVPKMMTPLADTVWDVRGGRLLAHMAGYYLVLHEGKVSLKDGFDAVSDAGSPETSILTVGERGLVRFSPVSALEKALPPAPGGLVLTQRPSMDGQFGETWDLTAYTPDGSRQWTCRVPGSVYSHSIRNDRLAVALVDLSAGGAPSVLMLDAGTGDAIWSRSLPAGAFRALGFLDGSTLVAALSTGVTAFAPDGTTRWTYVPRGTISAAAVIGDTTCVSQTANHRVRKIVYPYEVVGLSVDGAPRWSRAVRQEILSMQQWMGKEAMAVFAENHVLGLRIRDGARLFAERTGASPVSLYEDKLLIRDNRGLRLLRLRSIEKPAQ
ncbi:MAG: PQQ-binding-like beta-propeller repeat protein [Bacillota bacterium]